MMKNLAFPMEEFETRVAKVKEAMDERNIDLLLITGPENIYYISGFDSVGYYQYQILFLPRTEEQPKLLVQAVEEFLVKTTSWVEDYLVWSHGSNPVEMTVNIIKDFVGESPTIGIEKNNWWLKINSYEQIKKQMPKAKFVDTTELIAEFRIYKSPREIECVRKAAEFSDIGIQTAIEAVNEGITENSVAAEVYHALYKSGSEYASSPFCINSGIKSASLHGTPSDKVIADGDVVTLELGGVYKRYTVNPLRTVVIGTPSDKVKELHDLLVKAVNEATEAVKPGVPAGELDRITRRITHKYDKGRLHRTGYGLEAGYPPAWMGNLSILDSDPHILAPGMVFSIEPTIVLLDEGFGVILGNNVLVTEDGYEILNNVPLDLVQK
jgi:Xaa-Pro dipeptidase